MNTATNDWDALVSAIQAERAANASIPEQRLVHSDLTGYIRAELIILRRTRTPLIREKLK
jgi:hypothetical protein